MNKRCIIFIFLIFPIVLFAQDTISRNVKHPVSLHLNLLGMLDFFDNNFSLGFERRFSRRWSAGIDAGCVYASIYFLHHKGVLGYIARPFVRYYPQDKKPGYLQFELHYKQVTYKLEDWIGMEQSGGVPAYEEFKTFDFVKRVFDFHLIAGTSTELNNRLKLEVYGGVGYRQKWQKAKDVNYTLRPGVFDRYRNSEYFDAAVFPLGMRLVVTL